MSDAADNKVLNANLDESLKSVSEKEFDQAAKEIAGENIGGKLTMDIKVASPFNTYFDDKAFSITAENDTGVFDILPKHHNFLTLLKPCSLVIRTTKGDEQKVDISGGLMHVKENKVTVFLDI